MTEGQGSALALRCLLFMSSSAAERKDRVAGRNVGAGFKPAQSRRARQRISVFHLKCSGFETRSYDFASDISDPYTPEAGGARLPPVRDLYFRVADHFFEYEE